MTPRNMKTPEERKRIAQAYRQGVGTDEIRDRFAPISCVTLYEILEEHDVPRRKGRPGSP